MKREEDLCGYNSCTRVNVGIVWVSNYNVVKIHWSWF